MAGNVDFAIQKTRKNRSEAPGSASRECLKERCKEGPAPGLKGTDNYAKQKRKGSRTSEIKENIENWTETKRLNKQKVRIVSKHGAVVAIRGLVSYFARASRATPSGAICMSQDRSPQVSDAPKMGQKMDLSLKKRAPHNFQERHWTRLEQPTRARKECAWSAGVTEKLLALDGQQRMNDTPCGKAVEGIFSLSWRGQGKRGLR